MSQEKTLKTFKPQVISEYAQLDDRFRKTEASIPTNTISFTRGFVCDDNTKEGLVSSNTRIGLNPCVMKGGEMCVDECMSLKSFEKNREVKENENNWTEQKIALSTSTSSSASTSTSTSASASASVWDGPLSRYNTYTSQRNPQMCMNAIQECLKKMEKENLVDWEMEGYNAFGRMYHGLEMSEYIIYLHTSSDNQYQSVIEIRRSSGDTFVHDEFFRRISAFLEDANVLEHQENDNWDVDFGLSLTLEPLSLDHLTHMEEEETATAMEEEEEEEERWKELNISLVNKGENGSDDETSMSRMTETTSSIPQLGDELIEVVTDRNSYQDVFRHSSGILCQELLTNSQLLEYVLSQNNIVQRLIKPLTQDLFDTLIIRNILQVVKQLLQHNNQKVFVYANCANDIRLLKKTWKQSVQHNYIDMKFGRSQQVEKLCSECLDLLQKRF